MKRILFNGLGFLSLSLLLLSSAAWSRSFPGQDTWTWQGGGDIYIFQYVTGSFHYHHTSQTSAPSAKAGGWESRHAQVSSEPTAFWGRFEVIPQPDWWGERFDLWVPFWLIWLASAIPAACWLVRARYRRQERRHAERLCVDCGCDLKANSEPCPECGRRVRRSAGRWWRSKWMTIPLLMTAVVLCSPLYLVHQQTVFLRLQDQCMSYAAPADLVVFDDDPTASARLLASRSGYRLVPSDGLYGGFSASGSAVAKHYWKRIAGFTPYVLEELQKKQVLIPDEPAIFFLHGRRSPGGVERLVEVQASITDSKRCLRIGGTSYMPAGRGIGSRPVPAVGQSLQLTLVQSRTFRVFMGQPDPSDPSRFTIAYEINGQPGAIDGQLLDSGDVFLKPGEGPGTWRQSPGEWLWIPPPDPQ